MGLVPWTLQECRQRVRASARDAFPALFGARAAEASEIFYRSFEAQHLQRLRPLPGAERLLRQARAQGFYLGVVSNKRGSTLRKEAAYLGWDRLFDRLVGATDAARDKPDAAPVHLALDGSGGLVGEAVWLIGDTDIDLACAHNAGCVPVLLRSEAPVEDEFSTAPPRLVFADCESLCDALCAPTSGV